MEERAYTCVRKIWRPNWGPYNTCGKTAKAYLEGVNGPIPLCGTHANVEKRHGRDVKPIERLADSASEQR